MSDNLSISRLTTNQSGKVTTFNNSMGQIDALMSESVDVDLTSGNVSKNSAQTLAAMMFVVKNAAVPSRSLTLTAKRRFFMVECDTSCVEPVDIKIGSTTVEVNPGYRYLFWSNGGANHLALVSSRDPSGFSIAGLAPAGGSTGDVLKKDSGTDYDYSWQADDTGSGLPVGGTIGQVLTKLSGTDYDVDWDDQSGVAVPWDFSPPAASHFPTSLGTQTLTLSDDADVGLIAEYSWSGSSAVAAAKVKTITNSTWTMVAKIMSNFRVANYYNTGIILYENGTGKRYTIGVAANSGGVFQVAHFSSITSGFVGTDHSHFPANYGVCWVKIDLGISSANTYTVFVSADGKAWRQCFSFSKTAYFTTAADRLGIMVESAVSPLTGEKVYLTVPYWTDNA